MKWLIIRFSSIGDLTQALSLPAHIKSRDPTAEIHFLTKTEFTPLIDDNPNVARVWGFAKDLKLFGRINFYRELNAQKFDFIYDAHNNLRSNLFYLFLRAKRKLQKPSQRWKRFLLIHFKINLFERPFSGQRDLLKPLEAWDMPYRLPPAPQLFINDGVRGRAKALMLENSVPRDFVVLAPSAAHQFKRWPIEKWEALVASSPAFHFVILAGPNDHFTNRLNNYRNVTNLTGITTLVESAAVIDLARSVISNDTGLLHFAEQLGKPTVALMGAAPFGFPSRSSTSIIKKDVPCWPCSKHGQGPCVNPIFHKCMQDIGADEVREELAKL